MSSRLRFVVLLAFACVIAGPLAPGAFAQEENASLLSRITFPPLALSAAVEEAPSTVPVPVTVRALRRPAALPALYLSFVALQAMDVHSTLRGLQAGGSEASPVVRGVTGNRAAMIAVKGGVTAATIYLSEKLWKKNRVASIVLMAAINSAYVMIVANNYRFAR